MHDILKKNMVRYFQQPEHRLVEFHGGHTPDDTERYYNRRAEVWGLMRDWLRSGGDIPDDPELGDDLAGPEYGFSGKNQIQLEKKDDMKKRGLSSPDDGDCLAMSFAFSPPLPTYREKTKEVMEQAWERTDGGTAEKATVAYMTQMRLEQARKKGMARVGRKNG